MNYHVRKALYALEEEDRKRGIEPNWTTKMGQMIAALNSKEQKGKNQVSPYKVVFGMDIDDPEGEDTEILRECSTVGERIKLKENSEFVAMVKANSWTDEYELDGMIWMTTATNSQTMTKYRIICRN
jgi:hypothetical protein